MSEVDESEPDEARFRLSHLLGEYSEVFSRSNEPVRTTNAILHRIDTGDAKPFRQALRQQPKMLRDDSDKLLGEVLRQGVVEPSISPWASNVVSFARRTTVEDGA